ncbi:hypothetical protein Srut_34420 [Streptomyces rutgersensis]|nr:hypothetical protein Srut_34420 [Streptomyces rutgersensis]
MYGPPPLRPPAGAGDGNSVDAPTAPGQDGGMSRYAIPAATSAVADAAKGAGLPFDGFDGARI